jgi:hypothetical protein
MPNAPDIFRLYREMERDNVLLSFKGSISAELLSAIYQVVETKLIDLGEDPRKKKKVYHVLVELLQNIYHHMDEMLEAQSGQRDAMFMISRSDDGLYHIFTGNFILKEKCGILSERIEKINSMTPEELRAHHVGSLGTTELSDKGGAGLGIIDIARKSGNRLDYSFHDVSDKYSFFTLLVNV